MPFSSKMSFNSINLPFNLLVEKNRKWIELHLLHNITVRCSVIVHSKVLLWDTHKHKFTLVKLPVTMVGWLGAYRTQYFQAVKLTPTS